jgi:23S rRNA (uracil1939-C5)-methyltransferase
MDHIKGEISTLAFGGQGLLRHENLVIFVPFTAPGDQVTCQIKERKKNFAHGEVVQYDQLSKLRITPKCPYFGTCGGCQLQHLDYPAQLEYKKLWVEEALQRIGHLSDVTVSPVVPSPKQWAYRRHITLSLRANGNSFEAGYITVDNQSLVSVMQCPIFVDDSNPIIKQVQGVIENLHCEKDNEGKVTLIKNSNGHYLLHFQFKQMPKNGLEKLTKAMDAYPHWSGVLVNSRKGSFSLGETILEVQIEGLNFQYSPLAFIQNNGEQSLNIYQMMRTLSKNSNVILDLYCGIGISTLLLAGQEKKIVGIEGNPTAVELAKNNAKRHGFSKIRFIRADVKNVVKHWMKDLRPDLVLVNPPRTGLDQKVILDLLSENPQEILYLSCMPSTLARDLQLLCKEKYKVSLCQPFDMFPQTGHIETLIHLKMNK